ncbi:hypothetical protein ECG_09170 [Echinococcus granulosus]|nr:hypothetical protein ECG_09170 [Echinococcus granulosus]
MQHLIPADTSCRQRTDLKYPLSDTASAGASLSGNYMQTTTQHIFCIKLASVEGEKYTSKRLHLCSNEVCARVWATCRVAEGVMSSALTVSLPPLTPILTHAHPQLSHSVVPPF